MHTQHSSSSAASFAEAQKDRKAEQDLLEMLLGPEYVQSMQQATMNQRKNNVTDLGFRRHA